MASEWKFKEIEYHDQDYSDVAYEDVNMLCNTNQFP